MHKIQENVSNPSVCKAVRSPTNNFLPPRNGTETMEPNVADLTLRNKGRCELHGLLAGMIKTSGYRSIFALITRE